MTIWQKAIRVATLCVVLILWLSVSAVTAFFWTLFLVCSLQTQPTNLSIRANTEIADGNGKPVRKSHPRYYGWLVYWRPIARFCFGSL